jgi:N-acetylglucosaminyldiphosphoundecaprenol N-acetyl-beta-D-mannosaminyltransferase
MVPKLESSVDNYRRILGVQFYVGPIEGLIERTMRGGLIVVPSAPVMVNLQTDAVHRQAIETSDLAVTDSGFMVLLWRLFAQDKIIRISGLRYLRALLDEPRFRDSKSILWVMPSRRDEIGNRAWLMGQGMMIAESDCYLAPMYPREGPLEDSILLNLIESRRPKFVMINLGGGVQERLGLYLRDQLKAAASSGNRGGNPNGSVSDVGSMVSPSMYRPALICTGAAIAFLSNRQVNIPPWADRLFLGWLMRSLSEPAKFIPRYWQSLRLVPLLWKFGSRSVAS